MSLDLSQISDQALLARLKSNPHLRDYLDMYTAKGNPMPIFTEKLENEHKKMKVPNILYPVSDSISVHINPHTTSDDGYMEYVIVEPDEPPRELMDAANKMFAAKSGDLDPPAEVTERYNMIEQFIDKTFKKTNSPVQYEKLTNIHKMDTFPVYSKEFISFKHFFLQRRAGLGLLEPFLLDNNLEDISIIGAGNVYVIHKSFGSLKSPVFLSAEDIDELMIGMSEQFGKTVSHAKPLIDAVLPEGSRINIVFGKDVSRKGTNATIRKFASTPLSIIQVLSSGAMTWEEAAYLWIMLEAGMSIFVNGETASGKTTTLMGITAFIPSNWKIVTIEDTPELTLPHNNWITEATRDTGSEESSVTMFGLLKAALRQRPNYILIGEIRGAEGAIAFQAMQTGHPVISTFHAANMISLIQRLSNDPVNIPQTHMENLNIALFQAAVRGPDGKRLRRVLSINEIVGYDAASKSVMFIPVFTWDPGTDTVKFKGKGSSALFLSHVLEKRGMGRKDEGLLYEELHFRVKILKKMLEKNILNYYDVFDSISRCREIGLDAFYKELDEM